MEVGACLIRRVIFEQGFGGDGSVGIWGPGCQVGGIAVKKASVTEADSENFCGSRQEWVGSRRSRMACGVT